jgi:hypothetical protein
MRAGLLVALAACGGAHVQIPAPSPSITPADRVAMFKALERQNQEVEQVSVNNGPWQLSSSTLILANGMRIEHADDLLPVVPPDSDTAKAARASATARRRSLGWRLAGYGATIVGVTAFAINANGDGFDVPDDYMFAGVAIVAAVPFLLSFKEHHDEIALRMQAFSTYTRDLGLRLDVCAHGLEVVACETVPSPATAPNAPGMGTPSAPGMGTPSAPGAVTPNAPGAVTPNAPGAVTPNAPGAVTPNAPPVPPPPAQPIVDPFAPPPT